MHRRNRYPASDGRIIVVREYQQYGGIGTGVLVLVAIGLIVALSSK